MKITIYPFSGSKNHGCEALVRSLASQLQGHELYLYSKNPEEDRYYHLDSVFTNIDSMHIDVFKNPELFHYTKYLCQNNIISWYELEFYNVLHSPCDIAVCTGGDEYCYPSSPQKLAYINAHFKKCAIPTILWGCSIEPTLLSNADILEDLKNYTLITARDSITYHALLQAGLENVSFSADPAFLLPSEPPSEQPTWHMNNTVGINCSPLVISCEREEGMVIRNYMNLIDWILNHTDMNIALFSHVVWDSNDDRAPANYLLHAFKGEPRVHYIGDCNCMNLKYYISQFRFLVCARTHASIAAYSNCIPTLVIGYSVKSKGIATDLFGSYENYVISSQEIAALDTLIQKFKWIYEHEQEIVATLERVIPDYNKTVAVAKNLFDTIQLPEPLHLPVGPLELSDKFKCSGCHACYNACPTHAITMKVDHEGFWYPKINTTLCTSCGLCQLSCPHMCEREPESKLPLLYAAHSKCEEIRANSSSGGVFSHLAQEVLHNNGIVFGASFDDKHQVIHSFITSSSNIKELQTSKYSQSMIGDTYKLAEDFLKNDKLVYFSGTPCQIAGLKKYLKKDYSNLITQDLVCHGVPSPMVWKYYLDHLEKQELKETIKAINFRSKEYGWKNFQLKTAGKSKTKYISQKQNNFMKLFLKNYILRPSCYQCHFKGIHRDSDITLADFWGVETAHPQFSDDKGCSLIMLHSEKGKQLFETISSDIEYCPTTIQKCLPWNPSIYTSPAMPGTRNILFDLLSSDNFSAVSDLALQQIIPYSIMDE